MCVFSNQPKIWKGRLKDILLENGFVLLPFKGGLSEEELEQPAVLRNVAKGDDMTVNPLKGKQLTNMRASGSDDAIQLTPPWELSIERGLEIMNEDEYLEVTPNSTRLRKQFLKETDRVKAGRKKQ